MTGCFVDLKGFPEEAGVIADAVDSGWNAVESVDERLGGAAIGGSVMGRVDAPGG